MKKIVTLSLLAFSGMLAIISLSSSKTASQGVMGQAAQNLGCNPCHGSSASASTIISVTGIPATGYTPGTTYPVTLTVTNATQQGTGFDLFFSGGTISGNPAGTMLMTAGKELHHTQRFPMNSGVFTCNFNWTAPAAGGLVTLNVTANAVNADNGTSGDLWNKTTFTYNAAPNSVSDVTATNTLVYPNPTSQQLTLESSAQAPITNVVISSLSGQRIQVPVANNTGKVDIMVNQLPSGYYQLSYYQQGLAHRTSFIKK